jgi:hypothetical protein
MFSSAGLRLGMMYCCSIIRLREYEVDPSALRLDMCGLSDEHLGKGFVDHCARIRRQLIGVGSPTPYTWPGRRLFE